MVKNRFELLMEWYKAGMPDGAKYRISYIVGGIRYNGEYLIKQNFEFFDPKYLFADKDIEYIPPAPEYEEITPDEAVICLLNGETVDVRFYVDAYWTEYNLCNDKALKFSTYELIKTAMWRKKIQ